MSDSFWEGLRIIDISPPISEETAVFPGDVSYQRDISLDIAKGDHLTLSSISTTLHLGAHVDAPNHYSMNGSGIHNRSLNLYIGPCAVIQVESCEGGKIGPEHLPDELPAPRILFKTGSFPDPNNWNDDFWFFCPKLVEKFAHRELSWPPDCHGGRRPTGCNQNRRTMTSVSPIRLRTRPRAPFT